MHVLWLWHQGGAHWPQSSSIQWQPYVVKEEDHNHGGQADEDEHDETGSQKSKSIIYLLSRATYVFWIHNNLKICEPPSDHAHFDPAAHSTLRVLILVGALALHAVFEGLVFGVSQEPVSAMLGKHSLRASLALTGRFKKVLIMNIPIQKGSMFFRNINISSTMLIRIKFRDCSGRCYTQVDNCQGYQIIMSSLYKFTYLDIVFWSTKAFSTGMQLLTSKMQTRQWLSHIELVRLTKLSQQFQELLSSRKLLEVLEDERS